MASRQGIASVSVRKDQVVFVTGSIVKGARRDWRGIWSGLDDADFEAFHAEASWSANDEELGALLWRALKATRLNIPVPSTWDNGLWSDKSEYDTRLASSFGLVSAKELYAGMLACGVRWVPGKITLNPTRRRHAGKFEAFGPAWGDGHEPIELPSRSSSRQLGTAIRACVARCI